MSSRSPSPEAPPRADHDEENNQINSSREPDHSSQNHKNDDKLTPNHLHGGKNRPPPEPCTCLGIFGLNCNTTEARVFGKFNTFGPVNRIVLVKNHHTGVSRGFGFVYFDDLDSASKAREAMDGLDFEGCRIRVDYSLTKRQTESFRRNRSRSPYNRRR